MRQQPLDVYPRLATYTLTLYETINGHDMPISILRMVRKENRKEVIVMVTT